MDLVGALFFYFFFQWRCCVAASFGTSCIAGGELHRVKGHEAWDVYQFENDRVVELSFIAADWVFVSF